MEGVEFETDTQYGTRAFAQPERKAPLFVRWVMKMGVKDEQTANYILLGGALFCFGVAIFLYAGTIHSGYRLNPNAIAENQIFLSEQGQ